MDLVGERGKNGAERRREKENVCQTPGLFTASHLKPSGTEGVTQALSPSGPVPSALCSHAVLSPCPGSFSRYQLFPAAGAQETQVDRCRQLLYSLPTSVYLLPLFGMGPRPLLGMMSHTEGSKGSSDAGNQAGRRGYEAPERKESAGPGIWGGGRLLLGLTPSS